MVKLKYKHTLVVRRKKDQQISKNIINNRQKEVTIEPKYGPRRKMKKTTKSDNGKQTETYTNQRAKNSDRE